MGGAKGKWFDTGKKMLGQLLKVSLNVKRIQISFDVVVGISRKRISDSIQENNFSRTPMARTLMARLPRLFRTRSWVPWKKITCLQI